MIGSMESKLISNKKVEAVYNHARNSRLEQIIRFGDKELKLDKLSTLKINKQPLITQDDKIFIALVLGYTALKHDVRKRDSGRLFLCHPIDTAAEYIDAYIEHFKLTNNRPYTSLKAKDIGSCLTHDLEEEEKLGIKKIVQDIQDLVRTVSKPDVKEKIRIKNPKKYLLAAEKIGENTDFLTREKKNYYEVWNDLVTKGTKKQNCVKGCDRIKNVDELILETRVKRFVNKRIKEPLKKSKLINYPYTRVVNVWSTRFHKAAELVRGLMHKLEGKKKLYPNPKILYQVFKSFIIVDATNQYLKNYVKKYLKQQHLKINLDHDLLVIIKKRLINTSIKQLKKVTEHILKYHCEGLKREYALHEIGEKEMENPLLILNEPYLSKLDNKINMSSSSSIFKILKSIKSNFGLGSKFTREELTNPVTVKKTLSYLKEQYENNSNGLRFTVQELIHLEWFFYQDYINTQDVNKITYARKNGRQKPFDNLFAPYLGKVVDGDRQIMNELKGQHEIQFKLAIALAYKLTQYYTNHEITFDWGRRTSMKISEEEIQRKKIPVNEYVSAVQNN